MEDGSHGLFGCFSAPSTLGKNRNQFFFEINFFLEKKNFLINLFGLTLSIAKVYHLVADKHRAEPNGNQILRWDHDVLSAFSTLKTKPRPTTMFVLLKHASEAFHTCSVSVLACEKLSGGFGLKADITIICFWLSKPITYVVAFPAPTLLADMVRSPSPGICFLLPFNCLFKQLFNLAIAMAIAIAGLGIAIAGLGIAIAIADVILDSLFHCLNHRVQPSQPCLQRLDGWWFFVPHRWRYLSRWGEVASESGIMPLPVFNMPNHRCPARKITITQRTLIPGDAIDSVIDLDDVRGVIIAVHFVGSDAPRDLAKIEINFFFLWARAVYHAYTVPIPPTCTAYVYRL
jgi:hypothetical protein